MERLEEKKRLKAFYNLILHGQTKLLLELLTESKKQKSTKLLGLRKKHL